MQVGQLADDRPPVGICNRYTIFIPHSTSVADAAVKRRRRTSNSSHLQSDTPRSSIVKRILLCIAVLLSAFITRAQVANNTSLVGTVSDPSGRVVVGAKVVGLNRDTKVEYSGTTNAEGYYSIPFVNPGTYDVKVEAAGFNKTTATGVVVTINLAIRTDVVLTVGSNNTEVTISADTPVLSTDDALLGETVDQEKVHDLPMNGRRALSLAQTA